MDKLAPSMRPKVKTDTFFLPDPNGGVYFRNNIGSFQMEGKGIDQWIEKLLPVFNGEHSLGDLTEGLPDEYQERIYEIAELLYRNGFIQDSSKDHPHELPNGIVQKYASQIAFISSFTDSAGYRFQTYRQCNVLVVGSGQFLVSLVVSLLESGLPRLHIFDLEQTQTTQAKIHQLAAHARQKDDQVEIVEFSFSLDNTASWLEAIRASDAVLYVSETGDPERLQAIENICRGQRKRFIPAICLQQVGIAGPVVEADSICGWNSAWMRMHEAVICKDPHLHMFSTTAGAMLANIIVFELFKSVSGVNHEKPEKHKPSFYLLNLETLEGNWHSFLPHPLEKELQEPTLTNLRDQRCKPQSVIHPHDTMNDQHAEVDEVDPNQLLPYFDTLTSQEVGIFHIWEEADLHQLPLALCCVQAVDPLSHGPAKLLPAIISGHLTHEEARREAGLAGIEAYVECFLAYKEIDGVDTEWDVDVQEFIGVGAGQTAVEGMCRGLNKFLFETFKRQTVQPISAVSLVQEYELEDERCQYYVEALKTQIGEPRIALGEKVYGFPVVWVETKDGWYGSVGLHVTWALRNVLRYVLIQRQIDTGGSQQAEQEARAVIIPAGQLLVDTLADEPNRLMIPSMTKISLPDVLQHAIETLQQNGKELVVVDLTFEAFLKEELTGVFGVWVQEVESV